jgi:hypothetical protein
MFVFSQLETFSGCAKATISSIYPAAQPLRIDIAFEACQGCAEDEAFVAHPTYPSEADHQHTLTAEIDHRRGGSLLQ